MLNNDIELDNNQDEEVCDCGSGCGCDDSEDCGCGHDHDHDHDHDHEHDVGEAIITMTDTETGEEFSFVIADDFEFDNEHFCVLVTLEDDPEPEMVITKVVQMEDGSEGMMSLDESEYDRVYAEYERLCEEEPDEESFSQE